MNTNTIKDWNDPELSVIDAINVAENISDSCNSHLEPPEFFAINKLVEFAKSHQWKVIETVPKDGSIVDFWCSRHGRVADAKFPDGTHLVIVGGFCGGTVFELGCDSSFFNPTHWMPLPQLPKDEK